MTVPNTDSSAISPLGSPTGSPPMSAAAPQIKIRGPPPAELPRKPSVPSFPDYSPQKKELLGELVEAEEGYLERLKFSLFSYEAGLKKRTGYIHFLSQQFKLLELLIMLSTELLDELRSVQVLLNQSPSHMLAVGGLLSNPNLQALFAIYARALPKSVLLLKRLLVRSPQVREVLDEIQAQTSAEKLIKLLRMPSAQISRYCRLLSRFIREVDSRHPDFQDRCTALKALQLLELSAPEKANTETLRRKNIRNLAPIQNLFGQQQHPSPVITQLPTSHSLPTASSTQFDLAYMALLHVLHMQASSSVLTVGSIAAIAVHMHVISEVVACFTRLIAPSPTLALLQDIILALSALGGACNQLKLSGGSLDSVAELLSHSSRLLTQFLKSQNVLFEAFGSITPQLIHQINSILASPLTPSQQPSPAPAPAPAPSSPSPPTSPSTMSTCPASSGLGVMPEIALSPPSKRRPAQDPTFFGTPETSFVSFKQLGVVAHFLDADDEPDLHAIVLEFGTTLEQPPQGSFPASTLVDWMAAKLDVTRFNAMRLGRELAAQGFIFRSVAKLDGFFEDSLDRWAISPSFRPLNAGPTWIGAVSPAVKLSAQLLMSITALYKSNSHLFQHFGPLALAAISMTPEFRSFEIACWELQSTVLTELSETERACFFINTYHVLQLHARIFQAVRSPRSSLSNFSLNAFLQFIQSASYRISKGNYSLEYIEYAILRANASPPDELQQKNATVRKHGWAFLGSSSQRLDRKAAPGEDLGGDDRLQNKVNAPSPLFSFALNYCTPSSPPLQIYMPVTLQEQLETNARAFLSASVRLFSYGSRKQLVLPRVLFWYSKDFGSSEKQIISYILPFLPRELAAELADSDPTIKYQKYHWGFQSPFDLERAVHPNSHDKRVAGRLVTNYRIDIDGGDSCSPKALLVTDELLESGYAFVAASQWLHLIAETRAIFLDEINRYSPPTPPIGTLSTRNISEGSISRFLASGPEIQVPAVPASLDLSKSFFFQSLPGCLFSQSLQALASNDPSSRLAVVPHPSVSPSQSSLMVRLTRKNSLISSTPPAHSEMSRYDCPSPTPSSEEMSSCMAEFVFSLTQFQAHLVDVNRLKRLYADYKNEYKGLTFRPSTYKTDATLQFIPVNLHRQLTTVSSPKSATALTSQVFPHDITTFGAPTDHLSKFKTAGGLRTLRLAHATLLTTAQQRNDQVSLLRLKALELQITQRFDICISQAVGALITAFASKLQFQWRSTRLWQQIASIGLLVQFESLLSTYGKERGMLEDMAEAVAALSSFRLQVLSESPDDQTRPPQERQSRIPNPPGLDAGDGLSGDIPPPKFAGIQSSAKSSFIISFSISPRAFSRLPAMIQRGGLILVHPVLFTQGINETQSMAIKLNQTKVQEDINAENMSLLQSYFESWQAFQSGVPDSQACVDDLTSKISKLAQIVRNSRREKNVEVLPLAADLCRSLGASRLTSCKSAKDRTAMSVTWEQARILHQIHGLPTKYLSDVIKNLRTHGVRRENAFKNTGSNKFAFNKVQLLYLPEQYRAPWESASGSIQT